MNERETTKAAGSPASDGQVSRRKFLACAAGLAAAPAIVPSSVFGRSGRPAPSDRIHIGCIGLGGMGHANLNSFLNQSDARVVALCDVDRNHLQARKEVVDNHYGNGYDVATYGDFRDLLDRDDLDAISLATPDHWHAIPAILAARKGLDIYGEKPLTHNLREGRALCDAVQQYGRIWQTGSWQRSQSNFRRGAELVRNGRLGKIQRVEVGLPEHGNDYVPIEPGQPPEALDYEMWLGPAPYQPYQEQRVHWDWRWNMDYGGGQMLDWIGHHGDIAHWGMGYEHTGPVKVEGRGVFPEGGVWNAPGQYWVECTYADGVVMEVSHSLPMGTRWIGERGWLRVDRGGVIEAEPAEILDERIGPSEVNFHRSPGHQREFLDSVRSRKTTLTPAEVAHRSASVGHLGLVAVRLGRTLEWDPETETVVNDETANAMLGRPMRSPWRL